MAPGYRTNAQTRRGARAGYPEHDDFEGLPVRQWRKEWVNIVTPPEIEENKKKDRWAEELPHGMPKDSDLLPPHSLALLRAARSGCLRKRPAPADDEDGDADALPGDKTEKKASVMDEGFRVKMWKQIPRSEEGSTISYLAKRHKDTITLPSKALATQTAGPTITKATVRRIDAAGNPYTQEVTVTDGQQVDGEIISTSVIPAPEQAGQAAPAVATPTRRKPPIPQKKKGRGRGRGARGRGRVLPLQASTRPVPLDGSAIDGTGEIKNEVIGPDGVKIENDDGKAIQDVDMRDSSAVDEDGDEGEGDGDDGDDDEGDESGTPIDNEDQEMEDAPDLPDAASTPTAAADAPVAPTMLAPPTPNPLSTDTSRIEGSPLKNVMLHSPTDASPQIPSVAAQTSTGELSSGVPVESTLGPQPSPTTTQMQEDPATDMMEETPAEEAEPVKTASPEKIVQETPAPETVESETAQPETDAPETTASETVVPDTTMAEISAPESAESKTTAPETIEPETAVPDSAEADDVPSVSANPENAALDPADSEIAAPDPAQTETADIEMAVSEPAAPETTAPDSTAPEITAPEITAPEITAPDSTAPEITAPEITAPDSTAQETVAPESTAQDSIAQESTAPEPAAPESTAQESAEPAPEQTTGVVAITSAQDPEPTIVPLADPPAVSPAVVQQPPPTEDAPPAEPSTADIPIPTSEDPKTGEASGGDKVMVEPEAPPAEVPSTEVVPTEIPVTGAAPDPTPSESAAPLAQAKTEEGTDDGSDLLGPLGASLSRQAEEDVPPPTSAPAIPEPEQSTTTETGEAETLPEGNPGGE